MISCLVWYASKMNSYLDTQMSDYMWFADLIHVLFQNCFLNNIQEYDILDSTTDTVFSNLSWPNEIKFKVQVEDSIFKSKKKGGEE